MTTPTGEHIIRDVYFIPVEEEEYADVAARESRPIGWKVAREGRTRKVASEGCGSKELSLSLRGRARYSAKRRRFLAARNKVVPRRLLRPLGDVRSAFLYHRKIC